MGDYADPGRFHVPLKYDRWSNKEVRTMLRIWGEDNIQKKLQSVKRNNSVFVEIEHKLRISGYRKTTFQIKSKLKILKLTYYKIKAQENQEDRCKFDFFDQMDAVLGTRDDTNSHSNIVITTDSVDGDDQEFENTNEPLKIDIPDASQLPSAESPSPISSYSIGASSTVSEEFSETPQITCKRKKSGSKQDLNDKFFNKYIEFEERCFKARLKHEREMTKAAEEVALEREKREQAHELKIMEMFVSSVNNITQALMNSQK